MNEQLIKFIELCLMDGVVTDKEREVIFRKSKEYNTFALRPAPNAVGFAFCKMKMQTVQHFCATIAPKCCSVCKKYAFLTKSG